MLDESNACGFLLLMTGGIFRVLVVCTGNTCRSPMGAALLRHALQADERLRDVVAVESAGLAASSGSPAAENAVAALKKVGIDLSAHRSQPVSSGNLTATDLILYMTTSHRETLEACFDELPEMRSFRFPANPEDRDVPDPVGGGFAEYEACRDSLVEVIPDLVQFIKQRLP